MDRSQKRITQIFLGNLENISESPTSTGSGPTRSLPDRSVDKRPDTSGKLEKHAASENEAAAATNLAYPSETQLAAILGQILDGLIYLRAEGFEHPLLACENILLNLDGDVKIGKLWVRCSDDHVLTTIANPQYCQNISSRGTSRDLQIIGNITMRLMQKYAKENDAVGVDEPQRWPPHSNAISFLSLTTSASSMVELSGHEFLAEQWRKHQRWEKESVHSTCGLMSFGLLFLHVVIVVVERGSFSWRVTQELFAMIGTLSLSLLVCLTIPALRRSFYEAFIRTHQVLAMSFLVGLWQHLSSFADFPWLYLYIYFGVVLSLHILQAVFLSYHNIVWGEPFPRARVTYKNGAMRIRLQLPRAVKFDAGQYIGLWMPTSSFTSFFQIHPFMVTSWAEIAQYNIELFVEPRRGITSKLLRNATLDTNRSAYRTAFFSGPHGKSVPVWDFETVLLVATGFGIAAVLPYLRKLIRGYNLCRGRTRRIHLVWLVNNLELVAAAGDLLNDALSDDTIGDGYVQQYGKHARATLFPGLPQWEDILKSEIQGDFLMPEIEKVLDGKADEDFFRRLQRFERERGKILVLISGNCEVQDELCSLTRKYMFDGVQLQELDYQPE
ncbi:hypothetical protein PG996_005258 [Apiospora saccharicola]|uniref:ferric-chelate reductase (NADPH) n=1 Tax=Apiospora saccharicola TaxID=335842 RepID=A0ABR1VL13_9PEZI